MNGVRKAGAGAALLFLLSGCSPRDPVTRTPVYHLGVPTNRSTVNSTDPHREPFYAQPGVNGGRSVAVPLKPPGRGFEPNDPLADAVYNALVADGNIRMPYLSVRAKNGVVLLDGTVGDARQKTRAETLARQTAGVKKIFSKLRVMP